MAFFRCMTKSSGGGTMTETVLWENSNPSATSGFAAQAAPLSDDINNYDFIAVEYAFSRTSLTNTSKVYYKVSDYKQFRATINYTFGAFGVQGTVVNARTFYYDSDTQAHFGENIRAGSTASNVNSIPLYIYGCKA